MDQKTLFYDERFLDRYAGAIITDPATAIVELVANCWDAYATEVKITWPDGKLEKQFNIMDNGHGMTRDEFQHIWRTIAYDRISSGGSTTAPPKDVQGLPRPVFGKNGKGRFASFCFASEYLITSRKNGQEFVCRVHRTPTNPLMLEEISFKDKDVEGHGTEIVGNGTIPRLVFSEEKARELIGSRFLANPAFKVKLNGSEITFNDISDLFSKREVDVEGYGKAIILHINTKKADKTTKQHGLAWWVQNRAVGQCEWRSSDYERIILDGRVSEAKRFTFIVQADYLNAHNAVLDDWSGFKEENQVWVKTREAVRDCIHQIIFDSRKAERESCRSAVIENIGTAINMLSPVSKDRVESFVNEVVDTCPNFGENEIVQLSRILAKLEQSKSRYGLLDLLHKCELNDYDTLHDILKEWTVGMAKLVLDEIQNRLKLINELRMKIKVVGVDEVHELQPLFERGLWMFGGQFETIEFTSNKGMTNVIKTIFKDEHGKGSRSRPDFVALPNSSVGFYARPSYNENYDENGVEHLVIIDLKTTGLALGSKEKDQIWKYVKELREKGYLKENTRVDGFVLGDEIESGESDPTRQGDKVNISPLLYETILIRAERRLLNLNNKVKSAPFLIDQQKALDKFLSPVKVMQPDLVDMPSSSIQEVA
ncbi:ATP-binding protein [Verminephrobacter aporrectodeae subsp. tuberculatae]|uniref:ATP-binding protein n=1 Tax=Verminephrobacter aporrectodeae TaxID=1110389 RepID=UPI002243D01A|nr:ATP-binding protein [Verminephrobacter aporrectodeae]MCW8199856.1 ATP-binding protein [Verminephrobacter aporrectodeae subsp. tuberculatae]